jgi:hypothetical protein
MSSQEESTEGLQSCLCPFPLLTASLLCSAIFLLGDLEEGSAGMGW